MKNSKSVKQQSSQQPAFSILSLSLVDKSTFNPRKTFSEADLSELAESIKAQGVIQPIVVRPNGERYEVVCGERRYRASLLAGVETIPACIRKLNDEDAEEIAITENLQRKDVLPMEEARALNRLIETKKYDIASLVLKFGKSDIFVRSRIKLVQLIEPYQELLEKEHINLGIANILANYSTEVQETVYNEHFAINVPDYSNWITKRPNELQRCVENFYSTKLDNYFFDKTDCKNCAFNTANFTLFSDENGCGRCTKRNCLTEKNEEFIVSQALTIQNENPSFPFCVWQNSNSAALAKLQEAGYEITTIRLVSVSNEKPIAPEREDFEENNDFEEARDEYQEDLNSFEREQTLIKEQIENGELLPYIQVGQTNAQIAYAAKKDTEKAAQDGNLTDIPASKIEVQKLEGKVNRNVELCGEKIRENLKDALKKIEITSTEITYLEEALKYFFMIKKVRYNIYSQLNLEKKSQNLNYTDLLKLTEEQKAIITREFLVSHLDDMWISSKKIKEDNGLRAFINQHMPNDVVRIDAEQESIYGKRNARLAERVQAIQAESDTKK